jgi:hypothetical protein
MEVSGHLLRNMELSLENSLIEMLVVFFIQFLFKNYKGIWKDSDKDGNCDDSEIQWKNAGTWSGTATKWICYATSPKNQRIYAIRETADLCSTTQIDPPDANSFVRIVSADGIGAKMLDGRNVTYISWKYFSLNFL